MNKREVLKEVAQLTGIETEKCIKVSYSLETVLSDELEKSGGVRNAFDKIYALLNFIKDNQEGEHFSQSTDLIEKVASASEVASDDCQKILNALLQIINQKIEISKIARFKFDTAYRLVNFFKSKM